MNSTEKLHHAKLTIHNLPTLSKTTKRTLAIWLRNKADEIEQDVSQYAKVYTSRLMK